MISRGISHYIRLVRGKSGKNSAFVFFSNISSAGLAFLTTVLISRSLGPAEFGLFSIAFTVLTIAAQLSDFGLSTSLVRFAAKYLKGNQLKADLVFKVALKFQLICTTVVFIAGLLGAKLLAIHLFSAPALIWPLRLAFIGAFGASMSLYILSSLTARQSFKVFALVKIIAPLGKLTIIALLFLTYKLTLVNVLATFMILPIIAFVIGFTLIPRGFMKTAGHEGSVFSELFRFNKWVIISVLSVMLYCRLDILILGYFRASAIVGSYSAAITFAFIFPLLSGTITTVLLPKVSAFTTRGEIKTYIKTVLEYSAPLVFPLAALFFLSRPLIVFVFGSDYQSAAVLFQILLVGYALTIVINPISLIAYTINKPQILAYSNVIQLVLSVGINLMIIPYYGARGAAVTTIVVNVAGAVFISAYIYRYMTRGGEIHPEEQVDEEGALSVSGAQGSFEAIS